MTGTTSRDALHNTRKCSETDLHVYPARYNCYSCNKTLTNLNDSKKCWYNNKVSYLCSQSCITGFDVEFQDCSICSKVVKSTGICCDNCNCWIHVSCAKISLKDLQLIEKLDTSWYCRNCSANIFPMALLNTTSINALYKPKTKPSVYQKLTI